MKKFKSRDLNMPTKSILMNEMNSFSVNVIVTKKNIWVNYHKVFIKICRRKKTRLFKCKRQREKNVDKFVEIVRFESTLIKLFTLQCPSNLQTRFFLKFKRKTAADVLLLCHFILLLSSWPMILNYSLVHTFFFSFLAF